jgi:hypothetical protein
MPYDLADASLRFAAEVMPALKCRVPIEDQLIARWRRPIGGRSGIWTAGVAGYDVRCGCSFDP